MLPETIIVADLETTSTNAKRDDIIEYCGMLYNYESRELVATVVERFDTNVKINPKAFAAHGIAAEDLTGKLHFDEYIPAIRAMFRQADLAVYHNSTFDGVWLKAKAGIETPSYCTMQNGRFACHDGKIPRLGELCFALGLDYDPSKAHAAQYDVERTAACLFAGIDSGDFNLEGIL